MWDLSRDCQRQFTGGLVLLYARLENEMYDVIVLYGRVSHLRQRHLFSIANVGSPAGGMRDGFRSRNV